ncbi:MAG TPA: MFS transporter [Acidobacteriaceae bacterium]|jgi:predicted MFS family arabinose efflux permease
MQGTLPQVEAQPPSPSAAPSQRLIPLLGLACGITVSALYFNQPLLIEMARSLHVTEARMSHVAVAAQAGYAIGLLFFVPLGDVLERRSLILKMIGGLVLAMLITAVVPALLPMVLITLVTGTLAAVTHVILPIAPEIATPANAGRAVGSVMTGLLLGILLSRTFSGWIGEWLNWRAVFLIAAAIAIALAFFLRRALPLLPPRAPMPYRHALRSLWTLARTQPLLVESAIVGGLVFAAFSAFWTTLVFLLGSPHYRLGAGIAGSFGVLGAIGASVAPIAGRLADRHGSRWVISVALVVLILSWGVTWIFGYHIAGLVIGVLLMDAGAQASQVGNQTRIFSLAHCPGTAYGARSRINTVYMTTYFIFGALGSYLGAHAWEHWHWSGVCSLALLLLALAAARHAYGSWRNRNKEELCHDDVDVAMTKEAIGG